MIAEEATYDHEGNIIHETYSTKAELGTVESIAKGANQAVSFDNYKKMIDSLNKAPKDKYNVGQNIMIVTLEVPDLWISGISTSDFSNPYTYVDDADFVNNLKIDGKILVGYHYLSMLETQKVDLNDYPTTYELVDGELVVAMARGAGDADRAEADSDGNPINQTYVKKEEFGDIETALDNIIAIQEELMLPDAEGVEF